MKLSLIRVTGLAALVAFHAMFTACAADDSPASEVLAADAGAVDSGPTTEAEAPLDDAAPRPCPDCMYFPPTCTPDILCPNGKVDGRVRINVIRGRSDADVWAAGSRGTLLHHDGTTWTSSDAATLESMHGLWLRSTSEVALVSLGSIFTRGITAADASAPPVSPGGWTAHDTPPAPADFILAKQLEYAWAPPSSEWLWVATAYGGTMGVDPPGVSGLWRMRVAPTTQALEIADAIPPGTCNLVPCTLLTGVHGATASDLWAVGLEGTTLHVTGADTTSPVATPFDSRTTSTLRGVWAASTSEAWSVGGVGTIRHYTGQAPRWDVVDDVPTTATLRAVWGTSPSDVWAVGDGAVVLHFDGKAWSRVKIAGLGARRPDLYTVWSPAPGHAWIGGDGVILSVGGTR